MNWCWNTDFCQCQKCKIVPDSSEKFRNSSGEEVILNNSSPMKIVKQSPVRKNHFFTYFYKSIDEIVPIVTELKTKAFKGKVQTELTKEGRPHLQGMIWCKTKCRDTCFKLLKGAHFERLKNEDDTANYCNKDESHDGIYRTCWGFPKPKYVEELDILFDWEKEIIDIINSPTNRRDIHWYWEPDGCRGKTTFQKYVITHFDRVLMLSGSGHNMKNGIVQYKNKQGDVPRIILINIPRDDLSNVSYTGLEEVKDMVFYSGKYEGDMICEPCPHVIIFANEPPDKNNRISKDKIITHCIGGGETPADASALPGTRSVLTL